jgi:hypothetical protein
MKKKVIAVMLATVLCLSTSLTAFATSQSTGGNDSSSTSSESSSSSSDEGGSSGDSGAAADEGTTGPTLSGAVGDDEMYQSNTEDADVVANYSNSITNAEAVSVVDDNGQVQTVTFTDVINDTITDIVLSASLTDEETATLTTEEASTKAAESIVETISSMMTGETTAQFTSTIAAAAAEVASDPAKKMVVNVMSTVKTSGAGSKGAVAVDSFGNNIASAGIVANVVDGQPIMLMSVNEDGTVEIVEGKIDPITGQLVGLFKGKPKVLTVLVVAYTTATPATATTPATTVQQ